MASGSGQSHRLRERSMNEILRLPMLSQSSCLHMLPHAHSISSDRSVWDCGWPGMARHARSASSVSRRVVVVRHYASMCTISDVRRFHGAIARFSMMQDATQMVSVTATVSNLATALHNWTASAEDRGWVCSRRTGLGTLYARAFCLLSGRH